MKTFKKITGIFFVILAICIAGASIIRLAAQFLASKEIFFKELFVGGKICTLSVPEHCSAVLPLIVFFVAGFVIAFCIYRIGMKLFREQEGVFAFVLTAFVTVVVVVGIFFLEQKKLDDQYDALMRDPEQYRINHDISF